MVNLHLLCGIPGSGKSTLVRRLPGYVVATDSIRKFLWDDEAIVKHDRLVFHVAKDIIEYLLKKGESVIFDATNLNRGKRESFINLARENKAQVQLHWVKCPLTLAIERNFNRDRQVPVEVIKALHRSFQMPETEEGIDIIKVYNEHLRLITVKTRKRLLKRDALSLF